MHDSCAVGWRRGWLVGGSWSVPGAAPGLFCAGRAAAVCCPDEQVFDGMLHGWRDQQLVGISARPRSRRGSRSCGDSSVSLTSVRGRGVPSNSKRSARSCAVHGVPGRRFAVTRVRFGCSASTSLIRAIEWTAVCERLSALTRARSVSSGTRAAHAAEYEGRPGRRALTREELQEPVRLRRRAGRAGPVTPVTRAGWRRCAILRLEGDVRVGPASAGAGDVGFRRLRGEPACAGVRRLRGGVCAVGQGSPQSS